MEKKEFINLIIEIAEKIKGQAYFDTNKSSGGIKKQFLNSENIKTIVDYIDKYPSLAFYVEPDFEGVKVEIEIAKKKKK